MEINIDKLLKLEIVIVIKSLKYDKVFRNGNLLVEIFKVDFILVVYIFYFFFCMIWKKNMILILLFEVNFVKLIKKKRNFSYFIDWYNFIICIN